ncbi:MAG: hypothetical protein ACRDL1_12400 [Solirubrobacterales bacterium]
MERPGKRFVWRTLTMVAALAALTLAIADDSPAKKKKPVFKTGNYNGTTTQGEPIFLIVEKKQVTVNVDVRPPCLIPDPFFPGQPELHGQAEIEKKKVGRIAFGSGRKKVGAFEADAAGGRATIFGYLKGKKAEGFVHDDYPGCPYDFDWEAERE